MQKLVIIIPTFNRKAYLKELLSILNRSKDVSAAIDIIVVNDGSTDGTTSMLKNEFPEIIEVKGDGNWWWTRSVNEGLKVAIEKGHDYFLLMNDDTIVEKTFLSKIMETHSRVGGILGTISISSTKPEKIFYSGIKSINWLTAKQVRYHQFFEAYDKVLEGVKPTVFIPGRGMLFRKEIIDKIGYLDEKLFPQYFADYDFSHTALEHGFPLNVSWDSPVYSYVEKTAKGNKTNATFIQFIAAFFKPNTSNNIKHTWYFYKKHAGPLFIIGFTLHLLRVVAAYMLARFRGVLKN